ncbi:MAG: N-acetyl sugar amidotransferase [Alphaproteobacteria bacterium]|nr:N-acetyl sugar amidotransferase [Alphaproteobacteria bacterium]
MRYCTRCLMPDSRPRIVFDGEGVCNACRNAEEKARIDWAARRAEFLELIRRYRGTGPYDCVVPWSGGKDSSAIAHKLKFEFGLNPLLVTFSPLLPNEVGVANREAMLQLGFDHLLVRPNQKVSRHLARRFFVERGNPKVHWDAGVNAVPLQVAVNYGIPLVFYAEHGESEYGGRVLSEQHRKVRDFTEVIEHQVGDDPGNWLDEAVEERDLAPYLYPPPGRLAEAGVRALYFAWFFRWSMLENYRYIRDKFAFRCDPKGRTDGTFTDFDSLDDRIDNLYYYMQYIKFGFGRATRDACRMIQNGQMARAEGLELARKYDAEFPASHFRDNLEYLGLAEPEFVELVDRHRNAEIWQRAGNDWCLRQPPQ